MVRPTPAVPTSERKAAATCEICGDTFETKRYEPAKSCPKPECRASINRKAKSGRPKYRKDIAVGVKRYGGHHDLC